MNLQKSLKIKLSIIAALALSFIIALGAFLGITLANAERKVTLSGTSIFVTGDAEIWAHTVTETVQDGEEEKTVDHNYMMFAFSDDGEVVNYRKNLAFKWVENDPEKEEASEGEDETEGEDKKEDETKDDTIAFNPKNGWFNMEIGFADKRNAGDNGDANSLQFKQFVITFESQQYSQTKDGKTTNYIVFEPAENNELKVYIAHKTDDDKDIKAVLDRLGDDELLTGTVANDNIKIEFNKYENGNYTVQISDLKDNKLTGTFENVGKTYSKYSSSTTTPVTPLSFEAVFEEEDENNPVAHGDANMTLYNMNGQSFEFVNTVDTTKRVTNGQVDDSTPPVLCLDKAVPFIKYNGEITFDYTVIDVLTSSPSLTTSYYMLTDEDADPANGKAPVYDKDGGDYKEVKDSDNQYIFPHSNHYVPKANDYGTKIADETFEVKAAVKVVLKLTDTTSTNGQTTYVLLDWFVDKDYLLTINGEKYIAVTDDKQGATYAYTSYDTDTHKGVSNPDGQDWKDLLDAYQEKVTEAAKDLKAGSKNYFYLPSAETLLADNAIPYEDLTFSIYYNNGSQQSSTGKNANALSINLTKAGKYVFTIYAKDTAGNSMYYYNDKNEKTDIETTDIWNMYKQEKDGDFADMKKYLPWFEFTVEESEISIDDPEEQSTAYVGSSFTPDSFEINGVSVKTEYTLYEFQNDLWASDHDGVAMTYEYFSENVGKLLLESRKYFIRIRPTGDLKEGTSDYETFNGYGWNGSSLTFTPQTANAFYVIKCEASSSETATPVSNYMTIAAAKKVAPLKGEDTWVQDNVTSIILLCIAGASLIGIILLLVIKPKNKGDIDEVIEAPKKTKKTK